MLAIFDVLHTALSARLRLAPCAVMQPARRTMPGSNLIWMMPLTYLLCGGAQLLGSGLSRVMLQAIECAVEFWLALEWSPQAQWLLEASETGPLQEEVWPMPTQQVGAHFVTGQRLGRYGLWLALERCSANCSLLTITCILHVPASAALQCSTAFVAAA